MTAVYTKLRSGEWGLKITGDETCEGEVVIVRKKDGSVNYETVNKIIFENDNYAICTIHKYNQLAGRITYDDDGYATQTTRKPSQPHAFSELEYREGFYGNQCVNPIY